MCSRIFSPVFDSNEENFFKILSPNPVRTSSQGSTPSISPSNSPNLIPNDQIEQLIIFRKETMKSFGKKFDRTLNTNQELEDFANELDEMNFEL